jgi:type VI secretion system protein ImpB
MAESTQHKLDKIRPPRVQITYDVEIGDAIVKKELPFIVGIMADLSGKDDGPKGSLKERKFVEIDRDNFNDIMASIAPTVKRGDGVITFKSINDFNPVKIIEQDKGEGGLNEQFEKRTRLSDLVAKLDGNDKLIEALKDLLRNPDELKKLEGGNGNA